MSWSFPTKPRSAFCGPRPSARASLLRRHGSRQQQLFVFDREFKKLLSYPDGEHAGISDVRLADMDGDGQPDLSVGYWGTTGVQSVTLEGKRRWDDRALENVFCLGVTGPDAAGHRGLLAADGRGMLVPIDDKGKYSPPISLPERFLRWVVEADLDGDGQTEICHRLDQDRRRGRRRLDPLGRGAVDI